MTSSKHSTKRSRPPRRVRLLPRPPALPVCLNDEKTSPLSGSSKDKPAEQPGGPMAGLPALGSLSRGLGPVVNAERPLPDGFPPSSLLTAPCGPAGGLDSGSQSPVCGKSDRHPTRPEPPPPRFLTFCGLWVWRPGLGMRKLVSWLLPLSCTSSMSYTNLDCMSCKMKLEG